MCGPQTVDGGSCFISARSLVGQVSITIKYKYYILIYNKSNIYVYTSILLMYISYLLFQFVSLDVVLVRKSIV